MDDYMKSLVEAPLANATKINLPQGRKPAPRSDGGGPEQRRFAADRRAAGVSSKRSALFDYYATTDTPADRVAEHLGLYRKEQTGSDDKGKPIFSRVLDVKLAETQLAARRGK